MVGQGRCAPIGGEPTIYRHDRLRLTFQVDRGLHWLLVVGFGTTNRPPRPHRHEAD
jgi:hypothetical protein